MRRIKLKLKNVKMANKIFADFQLFRLSNFKFNLVYKSFYEKLYSCDYSFNLSVGWKYI